VNTSGATLSRDLDGPLLGMPGDRPECGEDERYNHAAHQSKKAQPVRVLLGCVITRCRTMGCRCVDPERDCDDRNNEGQNGQCIEGPSPASRGVSVVHLNAFGNLQAICLLKVRPANSPL